MKAPRLLKGVFRTRGGVVACAWSSRGLCALALPSPSSASAFRRLPREVRAQGPSCAKAPMAFRTAVRRALAGLAFQKPRYDLSSLTLFQRRVLGAATRIPPGSFRSYGELARRVGRPRACRAVGQAMKRNPIPLLIPCHRVVASDNRLGGFAGGAALKVKMLKNEGIIIRGRLKVLYRP